MYRTGTAAAVRAWHVMAGLPGPEGERHHHDYRIEVVAGREHVDERGMVVDLDLLNGALDRFVGRVQGADLDELCPEHSGAVTVERFAAWAHAELAAGLTAPADLELEVRVWESADAFGGYVAPLPPRDA